MRAIRPNLLLRRIVVVFFVATLLAAPTALTQAPRLIVPGDIAVPDGFEVSVMMDGLDAPTSITFDDQGRLIVSESGYGGAGGPKVTRLEVNGTHTVLAEGVFTIPLTSVLWDNGTTYAVDATTVYLIREGGAAEPFVTGLPGLGDHQANQVAVLDGRLFVSVGTVTNSAVVGYDNWVFGWLRDPERRELHDVPCEDITVRGQVFESEDPVNGGTAQTSAYAPFGTAHHDGHVVQGDVRCNGSILVTNLTGPGAGDAGLRVHAWGLRNPYGLEVGPDGALWATMHGFDARGSRPIERAWDCFYRVEEGAWYGWPDFACDTPVTDERFAVEGLPQPEFLLAEHPTAQPPAPSARFDPHAATNGFAFSPGGDWGNTTDAFIALFGDFAPATGTVPEPRGFKIVRVNSETGEVVDFATNRIAGRASRYGGGGFEHPSDVAFGPDGAMYVVDWGVADVTGDGLKLDPGSGVVWKISRTNAEPGKSVEPPGEGITQGSSIGPTFIAYAIGTVLLFGGAVAALWGPGRPQQLWGGALAGLVGGLVLGMAAILVGVVIFSLPWWVAPRIMASMVMGREAQTQILQFDAASTIVGLVVLLAITTLFGVALSWVARRHDIPRLVGGSALWGLAGWMLFQFIVWPLFFPLVSDKAFPPVWFALAFLLYGLTAGAVLFALQGEGAADRPARTERQRRRPH